MNMARFDKCMVSIFLKSYFIVCWNKCTFLVESVFNENLFSVFGKVLVSVIFPYMLVSVIFPYISLSRLSMFIAACFNSLLGELTQLIFSSKSAIETLEKCMKYVQS